MRKLSLLLAALVCTSGIFTTPASAIGVSIAIGDRPYYVHGPGYWAGRVYYVWVPGHWAWRHHHRVWIHGHYVRR
jgi:hypothetical protein